MKKKILIIIRILLLPVILLFTWLNLPFQIKSYSQIKFGNILVENIEEYKIKNHSLPKSNDWKILESLGFEMNDLGTKPDYEKTSDSTFVLRYFEGFDGPYLTYSSKSKNWEMKFLY